MFLTDDELIALTSYKQPAAQRKWLNRHGWAYEVRGDGRNTVLQEEARTRMLSKAPSQRATEPNLEALRRIAKLD